MKAFADKTKPVARLIPGCQKSKTAEEELLRFSLPQPSPALRRKVVTAAQEAWQAPEAAKSNLWRPTLMRLAMTVAAAIAVIGLANLVCIGMLASRQNQDPCATPSGPESPSGVPVRQTVLPISTAPLADDDAEADKQAAKEAELKKKAEEARQKDLGTRH